MIALKEGRGEGYADDDTLLIGIAGKDPSLTVIGGLYSSKYGVGMRLDDDAMIKFVNAAIAQLQSEDFFFSQFKKWVPDKHLPGSVSRVDASAGARPELSGGASRSLLAAQ